VPKVVDENLPAAIVTEDPENAAAAIEEEKPAAPEAEEPEAVDEELPAAIMAECSLYYRVALIPAEIEEPPAAQEARESEFEVESPAEPEGCSIS
jgi:hypothetical protein